MHQVKKNARPYRILAQQEADAFFLYSVISSSLMRQKAAESSSAAFSIY